MTPKLFEVTRQLAEQGEAAAQYNHGEMYACGQGVEENYNKAVK